jgi:hypothetical protein
MSSSGCYHLDSNTAQDRVCCTACTYVLRLLFQGPSGRRLGAQRHPWFTAALQDRGFSVLSCV